MITAMVSTYNSEEFIDNRLDNLLNQTIGGLTIFVYDAASQQNENQIVMKYSNDHRAQRHRIIYHRDTTRIGLYAAWNNIIKLTHDKYVATANTDDIHDPEYFEVAVTTLETGVDLVYCPWYVSPVINQKWPPQVHDGVSDPSPNSTCGHFPVWRKDLHDKFGLFDERFKVIGDAEWWNRLRYYGAKFHKLDKPMGCYATRGENNLYWSAKDNNGNRLCQVEESMIYRMNYDK